MATLFSGGPEEIRLHFCRRTKIYVRLRRAVAGSARPRCFEIFESSGKQKQSHRLAALLSGGPEEIRTPDPRNANAMRSQLRYGPLL